MVFDRILVPLDGSELAEESLGHAVRIARAYKGRLFLLRVLDDRDASLEHGADDVGWRFYKLQALDYLNSLNERIAEDDLEVETHMTEGRAPDQILDFIRDRRIDLVVLAAYGSGGLSEFTYGGTVQKIVAMLETSVMIVRPKPGESSADKRYRRVVVPLDGSQRAAWAVSLMSGLATDETLELIVLQVVGLPDMPRARPLTREEEELRSKFVECNRRAAIEYLEEIKRRFAGSVSIRTRLEVSANVVDAITRVADIEHADLIALTAHGASGCTGRRSGTICQGIVQCATRPVLVLQDSPARYRHAPGAQDSDWRERRFAPSDA